MHVLIGIALKSLLIAGLTLGLLAADEAPLGRRAVVGRAHRPARAGHAWPSRRWSCRAGTSRCRPCSARRGRRSAGATPRRRQSRPTARRRRSPVATPLPAADAAARTPSLSPTAAATALYAVPAAILLFITFLALARLIALRARADVLVDGHWLSALARAQRRMGFKHGTALLTSDELASPISWGLMRPVILLNTARRRSASGEAEAIIAHELAHVARMDWIKLLLARVATALVLVQPAGLAARPRSAPAARGSRRRRGARRRHRRHRLCAAAGRRRAPRMPRPAARRAWRRAVEELARPPRRPGARRQDRPRPGRPLVRRRRVRRRRGHRRAACCSDLSPERYLRAKKAVSAAQLLRARRPRSSRLTIPKPRRPTYRASSAKACRPRSRRPSPQSDRRSAAQPITKQSHRAAPPSPPPMESRSLGRPTAQRRRSIRRMPAAAAGSS